ncbi:MAG: MauE/DoxX family redox-associated membrane protein [Ferruginibacter sp.]
MKKLSLGIMSVFYLAAGINHFYKPEGYYKIIPPFFTNPEFINICSGIAEISLAVLLLIPQTRKFACYGIICMLIAFIPAHIYMIKVGFCIKDFCLPQWALWMRLVFLQPLLIFWAWKNRK